MKTLSLVLLRLTLHKISLWGDNMRIVKFNLSNIFNSLLFVFIAIMLISQLALTTPNARFLLTTIDKNEDVSVSSNQDSIRLGEITLKLNGIHPSDEIKILQNGEPIAVFYDKEIKITVADNSVIEIDGSKIKQEFYIDILNISDNIKLENVSQIRVNSNIAMIGRIFVK